MAVWYLGRAELRARWKAWLAVALLVGAERGSHVMGAVWYRFRVELRTRWRAWIGLGLLGAAVANLAAVLPARAAARVRPAVALRSE